LWFGFEFAPFVLGATALVTVWFAFAGERIAQAAGMSTSFSLFFIFYFLGYFDLVLDKPALTDVC
jgi:hypothetical protein